MSKISPARGSLWFITVKAAGRLGVPKTRPWLILQDDVFAAYDGRIACYLTSAVNEDGIVRVRDAAIELKPSKENRLSKSSYICCDSLYTIRNAEFDRKWGMVDPFTMVKVTVALHLVLGTDQTISLD